KRTSGVKNLVSNTGLLARLVPFIQPRSPTANGVCVSTSGAGSGFCRASGTAAATAAAATAATSEEGAGAAAGAPATAGAAGAEGRVFITRSARVALPVTTISDGAVTLGAPALCTLTVQVPGGRSAKEYTPSLPESVARIAPPSVRVAVTVA